MLLIYITLIAMLAMAGKPKRRRRMGKYIRGTVDEATGLSTLAALTVAKQDFDETVNERTLISSIVATYSLSLFTKASGAGPIQVGIAHSDYSAAEIEAVLEATGSWDEGDLVQQELSKRKIRRIGIFDIPDDATEVSVLNDGKAIKSKLNWILNQGDTLSLWGYNLGASALATTVPVIQAVGHANLFPR